MILVSGATGHVGGELVTTLLDSGTPVRALTRDAVAVLPAGAERVVGDLDRPESLADALTGIDGVFLLSGYQDMPGLLAAARTAGVQRVALLSGASAASGDLSNAVSRYMIESESAVRESGLAWTILRPFAFMSNAFQLAEQIRAGDVVRAAFGGVRAATIDPRDIAAVAALALLSPGHEDQVHTLTGGESLLPAERVSILGDVLDRRLVFEAQSDDEARAEMSAAMPARYVDAFVNFYVDGALDESPVLPTVRELLGRPPRTFRDWAVEHADRFRGARMVE